MPSSFYFFNLPMSMPVLVDRGVIRLVDCRYWASHCQFSVLDVQAYAEENAKVLLILTLVLLIGDRLVQLGEEFSRVWDFLGSGC